MFPSQELKKNCKNIQEKDLVEKAIVENGEKTKKYCKNMEEICIKAFQKK